MKLSFPELPDDIRRLFCGNVGFQGGIRNAGNDAGNIVINAGLFPGADARSGNICGKSVMHGSGVFADDMNDSSVFLRIRQSSKKNFSDTVSGANIDIIDKNFLFVV